MRLGIAIVGGNGSGKTTLGRQLAQLLGCKHMDVEDFYFKESAIPYANPRTREEVQALLLADMARHPRFILSAVNGDMGSEINARYDAVVYIEVPLKIRMERVKQRSLDQFGDRVREGGDMYEQEQKFFRFVAGRSLDKVEAWVQSMTCPVWRVDGSLPIEENTRRIVDLVNRISSI